MFQYRKSLFKYAKEFTVIEAKYLFLKDKQKF